MLRYAFVDLAAAVPVRMLVSKLRAPVAAPLLDPGKFPDLLPVGPWLVALEQCPKLVQAWREEGRWQSWGYTFTSVRNLQELRLHFRKFNLVELEGGDVPVFFRYYDPNVMLHFLREVATDVQALEMFGVVSEVQIEDREEREVVRFVV